MRTLYGDECVQAMIEKLEGIGVGGIRSKSGLLKQLKEMYVNAIDYVFEKHPELNEKGVALASINKIIPLAEHFVEKSFQIYWECIAQTFPGFPEEDLLMKYLSLL